MLRLDAAVLGRELLRLFWRSIDPPDLVRLGDFLLTQLLFCRRRSGIINATHSDLGCGNIPSKLSLSQLSVATKSFNNKKYDNYKMFSIIWKHKYVNKKNIINIIIIIIIIKDI